MNGLLETKEPSRENKGSINLKIFTGAWPQSGGGYVLSSHTKPQTTTTTTNMVRGAHYYNTTLAL